MVSAFASEARLVLGQRKVDDKSNEITAIPELLELLTLQGAIVTIDAMGCQKAIAERIIEQKADYVLALKGNHGDLFDDVKTYLDQASTSSSTPSACHRDEHLDYGHGRIETRRAWVSEDIDWLSARSDWANLRSLCLIEAQRCIGDKTTTERRYYLSSLPAEANLHITVTRAH